MNKYIWSIFEGGTIVLFQFLSLVVLSHLLSPSDYGVFGAMTLFISVGNMLADSGMGASLIKKENPTEIDYSTLFCFNIAVSLLYYVVLYLLSSLVADYYEIEALKLSIRIYGIYVIMASFGLVQNIQLIREQKQKELYIITLVSVFGGGIVAIILGFSGYGYWSLIFQHLVFITCKLILQFLFNNYIPHIKFSVSSFKEQFGYSVNILGANLLNTFYSNIFSLIIPKIGTFQQNGYYLQASKIQGIPMTIASSVMDKVLFPILSRNQGNDFLRIARKQIRQISWISSVAIIVIILISSPLITLLLGKEWEITSIYLKILLLASYGSVFQYIIRSIFKAQGLTKEIFKINLIQNILGIITILIASSWGINVLLWGGVIVNLFISIFYSWQVMHCLNYNLRNQINDNVCMIVIFVISFITIVYL